MSLKGDTVLDRDNLNRAFVSKGATGTQIMAGSLRLLGGITVDGTFNAGNTTLGTLTAGTTTLGALTITGALSAGAQAITTTGKITAGTFAGNGAAITALSGTNISAGTVADARLTTNVVLLNKAQTFTANNTYSAAANLYFAGGTTYYINTAGSAKFNALNVAGALTVDGNDYLTFGSAGISAPANSSAGTKIKLYGESYQIGVNSSTVWYDSNSNHQFYSNGGTTTRALNAEITPTNLRVYQDLNVEKNVDIYGELKAGVNNEFPDSLLSSKSIANWTDTYGATLAYDGVQFPSSTGAIGSLKITSTAINSYTYYDYYFDVKPNDWVTLSSYVFSTTAGNNGQIQIRWYNASNTALTESVDTYNVFTAPTSWDRFKITAQAPATAVKFRIKITNPTVGVIMYFSAFQVERGRALTGFKPYQGGKEVSLLQNGTDSILYSQYPIRLSNTTNIDGNLTINNGSSTIVDIIHTSDSGESVLNIMGSGSQGTGRVFVGQNDTHGGGIEYNGDGIPTGAGADGDYFALYRRTSSTNSWTARNFHNNNDWEFRGKIKAGTDIEVTGNIRSATTIPFLNGNAALPINVGGLLVSSSYTDATKVPTNGAWIRGDISTIGNIILSEGEKFIAFTSAKIRDNGSGDFILSSSGTNKTIYLRPNGDMNNANSLVLSSTSMNYNGNTVWHAGNDGAGSTLDADTVDGLQAASFMRRDADDSFSGKYVSSSRQGGIYGTYDSNKIDHIWGMGTSYVVNSAGTNFGNLYGMAYKHTNNTTGGTMAGGHQIVFVNNGIPGVSIGLNGGIWTSGTITADSISTPSFETPAVQVKSTTNSSKYSIEYNEDNDSLDFLFYA